MFLTMICLETLVWPDETLMWISSSPSQAISSSPISIALTLHRGLARFAVSEFRLCIVAQPAHGMELHGTIVAKVMQITLWLHAAYRKNQMHPSFQRKRQFHSCVRYEDYSVTKAELTARRANIE
jgi:hypothetical protein